MNLILICLAGLLAGCSAEESDDFYTGFMEFNTDNTSQIHSIGKVNKPVSILSLSSLAYSNSFALRTTRKLFKRKKEYFLQVNATSTQTNDPYFSFSLTIQYFVARQLDNVQVFTLNLTSKKPVSEIKPKRLVVNKSRCVVLPLGWSSTALVSNFTARVVLPNKFKVYSGAMVNSTLAMVWIQVQVVVIQEKWTKCGSIGVYDGQLNLRNSYYD